MNHDIWLQYADACFSLYERLDLANVIPPELTMGQFMRNARIRIKAFEAVLGSHAPSTEKEEMELMNLPRGTHDAHKFVSVALRALLHVGFSNNAQKDFVTLLTREGAYNCSLRAYATREDMLARVSPICVWAVQLPPADAGVVRILRTL
jgi:hypothetical protein